MIDTLQILQPIVIDTLSIGAVPVDVSLTDTINNVVLQMGESAPIAFIDKTEHNWFLENLLGFIALVTTAISIGFNIYQFKSAKEERTKSQEHEINLKKIETEEHRKEVINNDGVEIQSKLYKALLELDDLSLDELSRKAGTKQNLNFKKKIKDTKILVRSNRLYLLDNLILISEYLLNIYTKMGVDVESNIWNGTLTLRKQYEAVFKDDQSITSEKIKETYNNIIAKSKNNGTGK